MPKKNKQKQPPPDIVFDDDDSGSEDDAADVAAFHKQFSDNQVEPVSEGDDADVDSDGEGDDDEHEVGSLFESDDSDEEEEEVVVEKDAKVEAKLNGLKASLDALGGDTDTSEEEEEEEGEGSEDDEQSVEDEENSADSSSAGDEEGSETEDKSIEQEQQSSPEIEKLAKRKRNSAEKGATPDEISSPSKTARMDRDEAARSRIRSELKSMSIEEIQKLKERVGLKLYNQAVSGEKKRKATWKQKQQEFKRDNKNRPREMSSKKTVGRFRDVVGVSSDQNTKESGKRDPRFDSMCGEFDKKYFQESYKFVDRIRADERRKLEAELEEETDPEQIAKIKYLIQRYDNQVRERDRLAKAESKRHEEAAENRKLIKEGQRPEFKSKQELHNRQLVDRFEELKKGGNLDNYLRKKNKQMASKERKQLERM